MSYITSCLPLWGCRSLCTLESCNTFPCFSFTLQQEKTMLIVFQQGVYIRMAECMHLRQTYAHLCKETMCTAWVSEIERFLVALTPMGCRDRILQQHWRPGFLCFRHSSAMRWQWHCRSQSDTNTCLVHLTLTFWQIGDFWEKEKEVEMELK